MKKLNKHKLNVEMPTASQSDIAFLLIIFFIVTAIFFERTGIIFKLPGSSGKTVVVTGKEFFKIEVFNDSVKVDNRQVPWQDLSGILEKGQKQTQKNIAVIYFSNDLKYEKFIKVFQEIKKLSDIKISIKPLK